MTPKQTLLAIGYIAAAFFLAIAVFGTISAIMLIIDPLAS